MKKTTDDEAWGKHLSRLHLGGEGGRQGRLGGGVEARTGEKKRLAGDKDGHKPPERQRSRSGGAEGGTHPETEAGAVATSDHGDDCNEEP